MFNLFFNPCKYCLKKPVCELECDDFDNHISIIEGTIFSIISIMILIIFIICLIYTYFTRVPIFIVLCVSLVLFYSFTFYDLFNDKEFKNLDSGPQFAILIMSPYGYISGIIYNIDFVQTTLLKIHYRYHKRLLITKEE